MKLDVRRFSLAVATVWAFAGLVCAFVFKTAPDAYAGAANFLLHTDMYRSVRTVGWAELLLGVVIWWLITAVLAGASAALYNGLMGSEREGVSRSVTRIAAKA